jgi:thiol-disulfide isomerase/thioredoxin/uncharacterized membrane protein YphA (DoxX/SURF4 family)
MQKVNKITWLLRILIAVLFIVSAMAKIAKGWIPEFPFVDFSPNFAISTFEVNQLYDLGFSPNIAAFLSRILIGIEFALGILILQNSFLKRIIIPSTIFLLVVFIVQLGYEVLVKGNTGNCGCFGELIPMTPVEAIIKNTIAIVLLFVIYKFFQKENVIGFWKLLVVSLLCIIGMFVIAPINFAVLQQVSEQKSNNIINTPLDTASQEKDTLKSVFKDSTKKIEKEKVTKPEPSTVMTGYEDVFSNINKGKKILCFFAPGCDHCMATAKELVSMQKKNKNFPEIQIIFMDEEPEKIPDFFKFAGKQYPYKVLDVVLFWTKLGSGKNTPAVYLLHNGNIISQYEGIDNNAFNGKVFEEKVKSLY